MHYVFFLGGGIADITISIYKKALTFFTLSKYKWENIAIYGYMFWGFCNFTEIKLFIDKIYQQILIECNWEIGEECSDI